MEASVPINLYYEDLLTECVLIKIFDTSSKWVTGNARNCKGFGFIKKNIGKLNTAAKEMPILAIVDLDQSECAPSKIRDWLPVEKNHNLLFRIANHEIESWVLADRENFANHFHLSVSDIPEDTDSIPDPKALIFKLVKKTRRKRLIQDMVPDSGSTAKIGKYYNKTMCDFVRSEWDPKTAQDCSESLKRTMNRIELFTPVWR